MGGGVELFGFGVGVYFEFFVRLCVDCGLLLVMFIDGFYLKFVLEC